MYGDPPWTFEGRALYQLHLVKTSEARKHVPEGLPLVECCGYTLGGVFLARYTDSPVGPFDELVNIAGLVWDFPGSAAWASQVFVSNREACRHGREHCGLPSRVAEFEGFSKAASGADTDGLLTLYTVPQAVRRPLLSLARLQRRPQPTRLQLYQLQLPPGGFASGAAADGEARQGPQSPLLRLSLPNYSGGVPECPGLLRYACSLATRISRLPPLREVLAGGRQPGTESSGAGEEAAQQGPLLRKPLLTLLFSDMMLTVAQPRQHVLNPTREGPRPVLA